MAKGEIAHDDITSILSLIKYFHKFASMVSKTLAADLLYVGKGEKKPY